MKKIILVGLIENHHSLYEKLVILLSEKESKITVLTRPIIANILKEKINFDSVKFIEEEGRTDKILKRHIKELNKHDVLLMEYYERYHRLYFLDIKCTCKLLLVHNANKWVQPVLRYEPKHLFDQAFRSGLFKQFDAYITMGPNIKEYLQKFLDSSQVFFFPFDQGTEPINSIQSPQESIEIVLPGTVSERRRNYKDFLKVLDRYYDDNKNSKLRIKLLGKLDSELDIFGIIKRINRNHGEKIWYSKKFIEENEFEYALKRADIILSNINIYYKTNGRVEIYGMSKETGVSFIIYKYAKPAIIPRNQNILVGFDSQLITFDKYLELYTLFQKVDDGQINLGKIKKEAISNREQFNKLVKAENRRLLNFIFSKQGTC